MTVALVFCRRKKNSVLGTVLLLCAISVLLKPTGLETGIFMVVAFVSVIFSPGESTFLLSPLICHAFHALFPRYKNNLYRDSNPRRIFYVVAFVSVISSPKQTTSMLALSSIGSRTQDIFGIDVCPCNLLSETAVVLISFFCRA
jgi:hypothetical protein